MAEKFINDKTPVYFTYARNDKSVRGWVHIADIVPGVSCTKAEDIRLGVLGPNVQYTKFVTEIKKDLGRTPPTVQPKPTSNDKKILYALFALVAVLFILVIWQWVKMPSGNDSTVIGTQTEETSTIPIIIDGKEYGKMILVKGGSFQMGATDGSDDEEPVHTVTLSDYYICETEVTQGLWKAVMGKNPSYKDRGIGDNNPVNMVSWNDAQDFIKKLNAKTGRKFCLPTEAQWEFAARGGNKSQGYKYSGSDTTDDVAWYYDNSKSQTHPVKLKKANELGIYDMSGNVWEWCQDWYGEYPNGAVTNPQGPSSGSSRVLRGGSWNFIASGCRVSIRDNRHPGRRYSRNGMRLALPCSPFPS